MEASAMPLRWRELKARSHELILVLYMLCCSMKHTYAQNIISGTGVKGVVALTFDDGPNNVTSPRLLDTLRKYNVPASFFLVGKNIVKPGNKLLVERMLNEGHFIASHTLEHQNLAKINATSVERQVMETEKIFVNHTGMRPFLIRAPYGALNEKVKAYLRERNYTIVGWSLDTTDWKHNEKTKFLENAQNKLQLKAGIILMHEYVWTTEAAEELIRYILGKGLNIVPLSWFFSTTGKEKLYEHYNCIGDHPALYDRLCRQLSPDYAWEDEWVPTANLTELREQALRIDYEVMERQSKDAAERRNATGLVVHKANYVEDSVFEREMEQLRTEQLQQAKEIAAEFERVREEMADLGMQVAQMELDVDGKLLDIKEALVQRDQAANVRALQEQIEKLAKIVMILAFMMIAFVLSRCWYAFGRGFSWTTMENHLHHV